ncbi:alpha/beta hydrolase [Chromobacterium sphagni]|uniref:alpha/beta hydrolase n=1 Tax=Chromobacterium sphagni TaxID=1903179 RepID=UPI0009F47CCF|nr:alpha/beta hydrolase [Chromobacterium sphagni]
MNATAQTPHKEHDLEIYGAPLNQAKLAVVLLHGRRQSAQEAYKNGEAIGLADVAYILPIAKGLTWYPHSFMAPLDSNQPSLDQALDCVSATIEELRSYGFADRQIVLMGFSQGACLATEYIYRRPASFGGLIAFSGGLFGPEGVEWGTPPDNWISRRSSAPAIATAGCRWSASSTPHKPSAAPAPRWISACIRACRTMFAPTRLTPLAACCPPCCNRKSA